MEPSLKAANAAADESAAEPRDGARLFAGDYPVTPDGRYFVVRGRLWRMSDPSLAPAERQNFVDELMTARREVATARRTSDSQAEASARAAVDRAKRALGERGAPWWTDGAPDFNRHMAANTPYAAWFARIATAERD